MTAYGLGGPQKSRKGGKKKKKSASTKLEGNGEPTSVNGPREAMEEGEEELDYDEVATTSVSFLTLLVLPSTRLLTLCRD